jgi:hypothetical protein
MKIFRPSLVLVLLLLALLLSACTQSSPTPTPLANLDDPITAPGHLNATLQAAEPETFAGLWIENEPVHKVIVQFTRDGEKTLKPYIAGTPLEGQVEVRKAKVSFRDLTAIADDLYKRLHDLGLPFSASVDVTGNRVLVFITDQVLWENFLREAGLKLPDYVSITQIYEPLQSTPDFQITLVPGLFFPQLRARSTEFMAALLEGQLILEDGCLRVQTSYSPQSNLVIWQPDYFPTQNGERIEILNRDGQVVARVGEAVSLGGGGIELSDFYTRQLRQPMAGACTGPYFLMGDVVSRPALTPSAP